MALISCPECGKEVSDRAPACIHCGYPLSSAAPYADFRPITGPNRFTVRLTARPAYPDARSRTLRALMKELGLSREQGIRLLEQARREPVPLREGLTEEEAEQEIDDCHRQLIERLEKPERKLVLRIIDTQNLIAEERSIDSFLCGFKLAWELSNELNHYKSRHPSRCDKTEMDVCFD